MSTSVATKPTRQEQKQLVASGCKRCSKCLEVRPLADFYAQRTGLGGRRSQCSPCQLARELERHSEYRRCDPLRRRLINGAYRARKAGVQAERITPEQLLADWGRRGIVPTKCVYTGESLEPGFHLDHVYPLSLQGTPGHVVENIVPCNSRVNHQKHRRGLLDFLADRAEEEKGTA